MATFSKCAKGIVQKSIPLAMYTIMSTGTIDWGRLYLPVEGPVQEAVEEDAAVEAEMVAYFNGVVCRRAASEVQGGAVAPPSQFWQEVMLEMKAWAEQPH